MFDAVPKSWAKQSRLNAYVLPTLTPNPHLHTHPSLTHMQAYVPAAVVYIFNLTSYFPITFYSISNDIIIDATVSS